MATVLATVTGDLSDMTAHDFTNALVRPRANTPAIIDPDNNLIRIYEPDDWTDVAPDGTWSLPNLIAAVDTAVPGTLQWYIDVKVIGGRIIPFGPYVLASGTQDITALQVVPALAFNSAVDVDNDVLGAAEDYTDAQRAAHVAATNPHNQYAMIIDGDGNVIGGARIMVQSVGSAFNPDAIPDKTLFVRTS